MTTDTELSLAALRGRPMAFLWRYIGLHPARACDRAGHGADRRCLQRLDTVRDEASDRRRLHGPQAGAPLGMGRIRAAMRFGRRRQSVRGGSPAIPPIAPSSPSPAISAVICSATCRATRPGSSPRGCRAGWPAGSVRRPTTRFIVMNTTVWSVIPPIVAVAAVDRLHRLGQRCKLAVGLLALALLLGVRDFHAGPPRHAAASAVRRKGRRGGWRTGRRDLQLQRDARVWRDRAGAGPAGADHGRRNGQPSAQSLLYGAPAADPCGADRAADRRRGGGGHPAVAGRPGDALATSCWSPRWRSPFCMAPATSRSRWSIVTQYIARLEEAIGALLLPQELPDHRGRADACRPARVR